MRTTLLSLVLLATLPFLVLAAPPLLLLTSRAAPGGGGGAEPAAGAQDYRLDHLEPLADEVVLFDGTNLDEWVLFTDAEGRDREGLATVTDGVLRMAGNPMGYLQTRRWYRDYALDIEWRWPGDRGGNSGVLVHVSTPLLFFGWPRSLEVQLRAGDAGDFWVIGRGVDIRVDDEENRRTKPLDGDPHTHRRVRNLTDDSEKPLGEWNHMRVECRGDTLKVWVNDTLVNDGRACTVTEGGIALQSEGTEVEFRAITLSPLED